MVLILLAFIGGALTILSPCVLPVIPFVFSRAGLPFRSSGLPMLAGMALTFAGVATLASYGGGWVVQANQYGRDAALTLLALFALTLIFPQLSELLSRPFVRLGNRLSNASSERSSIAQSFVLGIATGFLWAPCAGPILGLILTGAALGGARVGTSFLLLSYAAGAATSLAFALLAGNRVLNRIKRSLGFEEILRRIIGFTVLAGVAVIAFGLDRGLLTRLSESSAARIEQGFVDQLHPQRVAFASTTLAPSAFPDEGLFPGFPGGTAWINGRPLTAASLRGKVVLVDFWTYSCINCLRSLPYVRAWEKAYRDRDFVLVGVHTPEFAFEKDLHNVQKAVQELDITYPVVLDNDYSIWNAFNNEYWPAHYLIDGKGRIRYHHFGEGSYDETERAIQALLAQRDGVNVANAAPVVASGVEREADTLNMQSPETYLGSARTRRFVVGGIPARLELNHWGLEGKWRIAQDSISLDAPPGRIAFRFHARDAHLVLGLSSVQAIRFRVTLDGKAPREDAGMDVDANGYGMVRENRLYQLVRRQGAIRDHTLTIEFYGKGVQAFAFTFG